MNNQDKQSAPLPEPASAQARRWRRLTHPYIGPLLFAVAGGLIVLAGLLLITRFNSGPEPLTLTEVEASVDEMLAEATPAPADSVQVYDLILPSLVVIRLDSVRSPGNSTAQSATPRGPSELSAFDTIAYRMQIQPETLDASVQAQQQPPMGSGVVINEDGAILTAYHVIERGGPIRVTFADGSEANAAVVGVMPDNDIAVLQPDKLPEVFAPATLGNPGSVRIGDEVYAVGNPLGLAGSISAGIVSGLNRTYQRRPDTPPLQRLIQFDSAVNVGSAGGPLLNRDGEVLGIVVGPLNPAGDETFIGIGFAVRIDVAGSAAGAPEL